jgi:hypothetical protein
MRRLVLAFAGLAAISCGGRTAAPPPSTAAAAAAAAGPALAPAGFEPQPNEIPVEYDLTRDGKPDVWKYVLRDASGKETLLRKEKDLNGDGRADTWERYAPDGGVSRVAHDLDFDGRPDQVSFYEKEQLVKQELSSGFDGVPRTWSHYEKGKLVRKERDTNGDARVDYWEFWENGELDRIGVDEDGDGQVDRWEARKSAEPAAQR